MLSGQLGIRLKTRKIDFHSIGRHLGNVSCYRYVRPFGAAHTCRAHIRECPHPSPPVFISILLHGTISFYYFAPLSSCSAQKYSNLHPCYKIRHSRQNSRSPIVVKMIITPYMYIPRFKSVFLERLLDYIDIPCSKGELHQRLMRNIDIPFF